MGAALLTHGLVLGVGVVLTLFLWPRMRPVSPAFWGRALLLGPLGVAIQFLLQVVVGVPFGVEPLVLVWGGLGALAVFLRFGKQGGEVTPAPHASLLLFLLGVLLLALSLGQAMKQPIHEGDALTNFALPARIFAEAEGVDFQALDRLQFFGHVQYPPLLAASEALVFQEAGDQGYLWNQLFGPMALLGLFLLLAGHWFDEDPLPSPYSWLALGIVMGTPMVLFVGSFAMADLRLLAAFVLLGIEAQRGRDWGRGDRGTAYRLMVLGLLCALTKEEGVLGVLVAVAILWKRRGDWGAGLGEKLRLGGAGLAALVLLGLWPMLLLVHGIPLFQSTGWGLGPESIGERFVVLWGFVRELPFHPLPVDLSGLPWIGGVGLPAWGLLWLFVLYLLLRLLGGRLLSRCLHHAGHRAVRGEKGTIGFFVALFFAHLGLFFVVFLWTPREVQWHLDTAGDRFLLATLAWPLLLVPRALATSFDKPGPRGRGRASHGAQSSLQKGAAEQGQRS